MGILANLKSVFTRRKEKALGYLSGTDLGLVERLFGREWSDSKYLETYSKSLYVYACVSKIAEKLASIDFKLNKIINSAGDVEEVKDHPILDLLYKWNPFYTKEEALEIDTINRKLTGDSFILKIRNEQGEIAELWNIRPDLVSIVNSPEKYISHYEITKSDGSKQRIEPEDIVHIRYPSPLKEYWGLSPLKPASLRIDTEEYGATYQRDFFLNNSRPDAILKSQIALNEQQQGEIRRAWENTHKGVGYNSKVAMLMGGMEYQQVSLSQREMDYIESMKATRDDILVAFKVPKPIIAISDSVGRSRAETESLQEIFLSETIIPEVNRLVNKLNEQLVIPDFGEEYFLSFENPVPIDRETRLAEFSAGVDKWITRNEIRQEIGLEPIAGGDILYNQMSMVEIGSRQENYEEDTFKNLHGKRKLKTKFKLKRDWDSIKKSIEKAIIDSSDIKTISDCSLLKNCDYRKIYWDYSVKAVDKYKEKLRRSFLIVKTEQMNNFLEKFENNVPITKKDLRKLFNIKAENKRLREWAFPRYAEIFKDAGQEAISLIAIDKPFDMEKAITKIGPKINDLLMARAVFFAKSVNNTTLLKLTDTIAQGIDLGEGIEGLRKRIKDVYEDFSDYRAELIARTEAITVMNQGRLEAYRQADAEGKEWIATLDDRVRDEHLLMDGEIVGLGEAFSNGLQSPAEPNCRCAIAPVMRMLK